MLELNPTFLFTWKGSRTQKLEPYHSHDHVELAYILSGTGRYRIEDEDYDIEEGDLIVLNPGVRHQSLFVKDADPRATEFFVGFSDIQLEGCEKNHFPLPAGQYIRHTTGDLRQRLFRLCASMEAEKSQPRIGRYHMLKSYLLQILILLIRDQAAPAIPQPSCAFESVNKKHVVEQIVNYFEDHFVEKISLDQIADNMYLSPFYISKIFKSETGDTPIRHLINIRLDKAKELLEEDESQSIQEIAAQVGYDDAYHFSKLFKKRYGVAPSLWNRSRRMP
ncbi:MAG: AraC family transcriptional regulator [Clostridium sp.]|jgi:AraC-like DNA-binding protein|nr:AraC family transcriptional regulator [Clostridium sp.]